MKTNLKISSFFVLTILFFTFSCGSDDNSGGSSGISTQNLVTNFNENPILGATVGTIQATSDNTLSFSINSQTPSGALSINSSTGELTVADTSVFDFETNPIINASISIIDQSDMATASATINVNNLDDIASFLSTSEVAYTATPNGDWVVITEAEYNALASNLNEVTKVATTDADYIAYETDNLNAPTSFTAANNNGVTMPNGSFVFAFKTNCHANSTTNKVKQSSTSVSDGFMDLGSVLPSNVVGHNYFVLKGSNSPTTAVGYLAIHSDKNLRYKRISSKNTATGPNDANTLPNTDDVIVLYQGLSTTQKQW